MFRERAVAANFGAAMTLLASPAARTFEAAIGKDDAHRHGCHGETEDQGGRDESLHVRAPIGARRMRKLPRKGVGCPSCHVSRIRHASAVDIPAGSEQMPMSETWIEIIGMIDQQSSAC